MSTSMSSFMPLGTCTGTWTGTCKSTWAGTHTGTCTFTCWRSFSWFRPYSCSCCKKTKMAMNMNMNLDMDTNMDVDMGMSKDMGADMHLCTDMDSDMDRDSRHRQTCTTTLPMRRQHYWIWGRIFAFKVLYFNDDATLSLVNVSFNAIIWQHCFKRQKGPIIRRWSEDGCVVTWSALVISLTATWSSWSHWGRSINRWESRRSPRKCWTRRWSAAKIQRPPEIV